MCVTERERDTGERGECAKGAYLDGFVDGSELHAQQTEEPAMVLPPTHSKSDQAIPRTDRVVLDQFMSTSFDRITRGCSAPLWIDNFD